MFNFFKKDKTVSISAPMTGKVIAIEEVPDEVFAQKMVGDGLAIDPTEGIVVAPVDGEISQLFPTEHAIVVKTKENIEILIHVGMDTVNLKGEGFKALISKGDKVSKGDPLLEFDLEYIKKHAKSAISPITITETENFKEFKKKEGEVEKGKDEVLNIKF